MDVFERLVAGVWNGYRAWRARVHASKRFPGDIFIGESVPVGFGRSAPIVLWRTERSKHVTVLGKSGMGKTTLLSQMAVQDIKSGNGFLFIDLHGQVSPQLAAHIAHRAASHARLPPAVIIDPADRDRSVGINVLEARDDHDAHVKVAEIVATLRARWKLDAFGARTEELLRNSLLLLSALRLTLLEVEPLLTDPIFRLTCLSRALPSTATEYFRNRFERLSPQMRAVVVEPVINKLTAFTSDPHIRHIVGQASSTVNFPALLDHGGHVVVDLDKGRLGAHAATLGSLILIQFRQALFTRERKSVFTLYCDEIQNLVVFDQGLEDLLAESRKFGVSVVSANQFLDQLTPAMRSSLLSTSTLICFQLSGLDALRIAHLSGASRPTVERLRTLPIQHFAINGRFHRFAEGVTPLHKTPPRPQTRPLRLLHEAGTMHRNSIESDIAARSAHRKDHLHAWE